MAGVDQPARGLPPSPDQSPTHDATSALPRRGGLRLATRWVLPALAVGVPWLLYTSVYANDARLRGLLTRGVTTDAHVTGYNTAGREWHAQFEYQVGGQLYTGSVLAEHAPVTPGLALPVVYLPEDPRHYHVGAPLTADAIERERRKSLPAVFWPAVLFGGAFVGNEVDIRRRRKAAAATTAPFMRPAASGRLVSGLLLAVLLGVQLDPNVRAKSVEAFGPRPLGFPNIVFVLLLTTLLWLPLPWVFRHGMSLMHWKLAAGYRPRQFVWKRFVGQPDVDPDLRRSQAVVLFGALYLVALAGGWIAYAAWRGS
jgi:hypothetical protein